MRDESIFTNVCTYIRKYVVCTVHVHAAYTKYIDELELITHLRQRYLSICTSMRVCKLHMHQNDIIVECNI